MIFNQFLYFYFRTISDKSFEQIINIIQIETEIEFLLINFKLNQKFQILTFIFKK